jgi:transcriptional regulator with XRE-family HTH domain
VTREDIASILKASRVSSGLTQKQAAEAIGRKQQTLASWETGQSQPDANTLFELFDVYGISVDDAFGLSYKQKNPPAKAEGPNLSDKAYEVARAYQDADQHTKDIVCLALRLEPEKSTSASSDAAV